MHVPWRWVVLSFFVLCGCGSKPASKTTEECKKQLCAFSGLCVAKKGVCVAESDAACRASERCRTKGDCTMHGEHCAPGSDADCQAASEPLGRSFSKSLAMCVGALPCADQTGCLANGYCKEGVEEHKTIEQGTKPGDVYVSKEAMQVCRLGTDEDCARSTGCALTGSCSVVTVGTTTFCGPKTADDCKKSTECQTKGYCALGPSGRCVPASDADCQKDPFQCGEHGNCAFKDGHCVATAETCKTTKNCQTKGRCSLDPATGRCSAVTKADCKAVCAEAGLCETISSPSGGQDCVNFSDQQCRASRACKEKRLCQHGAGYCVEPY